MGAALRSFEKPYRLDLDSEHPLLHYNRIVNSNIWERL